MSCTTATCLPCITFSFLRSTGVLIVRCIIEKFAYKFIILFSLDMALHPFGFVPESRRIGHAIVAASF